MLGLGLLLYKGAGGAYVWRPTKYCIDGQVHSQGKTVEHVPYPKGLRRGSMACHIVQCIWDIGITQMNALINSHHPSAIPQGSFRRYTVAIVLKDSRVHMFFQL